MFEEITYEKILKQMLDRVPEGMDKREGSIIYDSLAPSAVELQNTYIELDWMLKQIFADTADRDYLISRCAEWGIAPNPATRAVLKGEFNIDIEIGSRFSLNTLNYIAVEKINTGIYKMECVTAGSAGNQNLGPMLPILYIPGLTKAELTEVLVEGVEEEKTEALRDRLLIKIQKPSTSGNKYDYYNWAMECAGVGAAKVFPLAGGPGTVKVVIADASMAAADSSLLKSVKDHIEELRPIGATLTVASAVEKGINVSARVKLSNGLNLGTVQNLFQVAVEDYLKDYAFDLSYISLARIGNLLLDTAGIEDYTELLLNGVAGNVALSDEEIAVAGTVTLEVM